MTPPPTLTEPVGPLGPPSAPDTALQALRLGLRDTFTLRALGSLLALWLASALFWNCC